MNGTLFWLHLACSPHLWLLTMSMFDLTWPYCWCSWANDYHWLELHMHRNSLFWLDDTAVTCITTAHPPFPPPQGYRASQWFYSCAPISSAKSHSQWTPMDPVWQCMPSDACSPVVKENESVRRRRGRVERGRRMERRRSEGHSLVSVLTSTKLALM